MAESEYRVPADSLERTIEVRKSRFIARAARAASREEALAEIARMRRVHPQARHHCWAYLLGNPAAASSAAASDDGEPSGTAGRPILRVIQHKHIGDVVVVVSRYFGGVKLGAGGLVRAYGGATEAVLSELAVTRHRPMLTAILSGNFASEQALRHWAQHHQATIESVDYGAATIVRMRIPGSELATLQALCAARSIIVVTP